MVLVGEATPSPMKDEQKDVYEPIVEETTEIDEHSMRKETNSSPATFLNTMTS